MELGFLTVTIWLAAIQVINTELFPPYISPQIFTEINDDCLPTFRAALAQAVQLHQLPEVLLLNMSLLSKKGSQTGGERAAFLLYIIKPQELGNKGTIGGKSLVMMITLEGPHNSTNPPKKSWQGADLAPPPPPVLAMPGF